MSSLMIPKNGWRVEAVPSMHKKHRFITHKSEIQNHGLGIESVKRIMEKYQGEIYFSYNYKVFEAKCMIF